MSIPCVTDGLFDNGHDSRAFDQRCNGQGSTGGGHRRDLPVSLPGMEEEYRRRCKAEPRRFNVGDCRPWEVESQPWAFNLVTQEGV